LPPSCAATVTSTSTTARRSASATAARTSGTPYCITVDGQTLQDRTVTIRDRDTLDQWRVKVDDCVDEVRQRLR